MDNEKRQHLERLLKIHQRRLRVLEAQEARAGADAKPDILIEIEDIRERIADIESQLAGRHIPDVTRREPAPQGFWRTLQASRWMGVWDCWLFYDFDRIS